MPTNRHDAAAGSTLDAHWMCNALAYIPKAQQRMAAAALRQSFIQPDRAGADQALRHEALDPDTLRASERKATGETFLIDPSKG